MKLECSEDVVSGHKKTPSKLDVKWIILKDEYDAKSKVLTELQHNICLLSHERDSIHIKLRQANDMVKQLNSGAVLQKQRRKIKYMSQKEIKLQTKIANF